VDLEEIDRRLGAAGLTRSNHPSHSAACRAPRFARSTVAELSRPFAAPVVANNGARLFQVSAWEGHRWLWNGFSTRQGGVSRAYCPAGAEGELNLGFTSEDPTETVTRNRELLAEAVSGDPKRPVFVVRQFHSNLIHVVRQGNTQRARPLRADGLITSEPGLLLAIQTADCIPVLVADRKLRVVAAFHAGWRGTLKRIVELGIGRMRLEFGSKPENLLAAIGPGIGACCYVVGEEVLSQFESQFQYARALFCEVYDSDPVRKKYPLLFLTQRAPGHSSLGPELHLDLVEANRRQLLGAGLCPENIHQVGGCTGCRTDLFFSHRAAQGRAGRMMGVIGIRPN
jgi:polyphenol oxidase